MTIKQSSYSIFFLQFRKPSFREATCHRITCLEHIEFQRLPAALHCNGDHGKENKKARYADDVTNIILRLLARKILKASNSD